MKNIDEQNIDVESITSNLDDDFTKEIINKEEIIQISKLIEEFNKDVNEKIKKIIDNKKQLKLKIIKIKEDLLKKHETENKNINDEINTIPDMRGKTAPELLEEYLKIIKEIEIIKPKEKLNNYYVETIAKKEDERKNLLEELAKLKDKHNDEMRKIIKKINKKQLKNKVKIEVYKEKNRSELIRYLAQKDGLAEKGLEWINDVNEFSIESFINNLIGGKEALINEYGKYGLTAGKADIITKISRKEIFEIQCIELNDVIDIQLYIDGKKEFKSLNKLSKGQQCTAILYILLLENVDPLIIDQPEDNLDNSFISSDLIDVLRDNKMKRQFIFATHNANIPVFGDSECIVVMEEENGHGINRDENIGSIDDKNVCDCVINILEGGKNAFEMRKEKYGI